MTQSQSPLPRVLEGKYEEIKEVKNQSPLPPGIKSPGEDKKSPEVVKAESKILYDFPTAIKMVTDGKKISRKEWKNPKIYGVMKNEALVLCKEDRDHSWIISTGDLTSKDWFVV